MLSAGYLRYSVGMQARERAAWAKDSLKRLEGHAGALEIFCRRVWRIRMSLFVPTLERGVHVR